MVLRGSCCCSRLFHGGCHQRVEVFFLHRFAGDADPAVLIRLRAEGRSILGTDRLRGSLRRRRRLTERDAEGERRLRSFGLFHRSSGRHGRRGRRFRLGRKEIFGGGVHRIRHDGSHGGADGCTAERVHPKGPAGAEDDRLDGFAAALGDGRMVRAEVDVKGGAGPGLFHLHRDRLGLRRSRFGRRRCGRPAALHHLMAPVENARQPAGRLDVERRSLRLFSAVVFLVLGEIVVIPIVLLRFGLFCRAGRKALGTAGGVLLVDREALFVDAAAHIAEPLPALGGGDVKDVQAGAGRQRRHDQIGGRSAAEQQERPAQHSAQCAAREPCTHPILIAGGGHLRGGLVGGDVRKDDDRTAGEDEAQHKLGDVGQEVFAPGIEDGQIAQRCPHHKASTAEQAEQNVMHRAPCRAARHEGQRHEHQPCEQGDKPRWHPVLRPFFAARGAAPRGSSAFSFCHDP